MIENHWGTVRMGLFFRGFLVSKKTKYVLLYLYNKINSGQMTVNVLK